MRYTGASIIGIGESSVGKHPHESTQTLAASVVQAAIADAEIDWQDIDGLVVTQPLVGGFPRHSLAVAEQLGISRQLAFADTVSMGGASSVLSLQRASDAIRNNRASTVLIVAADTPRTGQEREESVRHFAKQRHPSWEQPIGMLNLSAYALLADEYLRQHSLERDALIEIPVAMRSHARSNRNAAYTDSMTREEALASRLVSDPLRLVECSPINDGGVALVVTDTSNRGSSSTDSIAIRGSGFATDYDSVTYKVGESVDSPRRAFARAAKDSALGIGDCDLLMICDSYSIATAIQLESIGASAKGRAPEDFREGKYSTDGEVPVNPHGGLLSHGHCGGATGMHHLTELIKQLRGVADGQVSLRDGVGLLQAEGGIISAAASMFLTRMQ